MKIPAFLLPLIQGMPLISYLRRVPILWRAALPGATLVLTLHLFAVVSSARAQNVGTIKSLYSFTGGTDGGYVLSGLVRGNDGNFYGTTVGDGSGSGASDYGTVFRISPTGGFATIHVFSGLDGAHPQAKLIKASDGNFYGTTSAGGSTFSDINQGEGTVFSITPSGVLTSLYSFGISDVNGNGPQGALVQGKDGNLYGTTADGGNNNNTKGTIFRISLTGAFTSLHSLNGTDGDNPEAGLVQGRDGNFYGTTATDDVNGAGTIFKVTPGGTFTTIYRFSGGGDGQYPRGDLALGSDGNFYGTTSTSGSGGSGTVFCVTPAGTLTSLYAFSGSDGAVPDAGLLLGSNGNFYGTTSEGGDREYGQGTIFEITPTGALTMLATFTGTDGSAPEAGLVQDSEGNFYGTTSIGGNQHGNVFKLTVTPTPSPFFSNEVSLGNNLYYLSFPNGNYFGYYAYLTDPDYIYHFDLGYEYIFDADDGKSGVYLYDFASGDFFYTSPTFPFPYLYDFSLKSVLYYFPDTSNKGHYTTNPRYFFEYATGTIITR